MGEEESKDNLITFSKAVLNPGDQKKLISLELLDNNEVTGLSMEQVKVLEAEINEKTH